jgi:hypothetical protein
VGEGDGGSEADVPGALSKREQRKGVAHQGNLVALISALSTTAAGLSLAGGGAAQGHRQPGQPALLLPSPRFVADRPGVWGDLPDEPTGVVPSISRILEIGFMDPKPRPNHRLYLQVLARMTPEQRLMKACELSAFTKALFKEGLRRRFPDLSDEELHQVFLERLARCHNQNW